MNPNADPTATRDDLDGALRAAFDPRGGPALAPPPSIIDEIGRRTGVDPHLCLRDDSAEPGGTPMLDPGSPERRSVPRGRRAFELLGEIARGGMGVVLKGHDRDLGRDVAVKVLRSDRADDAALVQRFVEEAQIGGQLQHPGIVPVYDVGLMEDDRPYFTMKLIKGRTLAELLADRKRPSDERRRMLGIFEHVCQTVGYAHARGVIHRDLKPSNVMVGAFGEVLVMDWGLAKVMRRGSSAGEKHAESASETVVSTVRTAPDSDGSRSRVGSVMGTPAYMSPEQARGEVESVDQRSDVFALGAILCEILSGKPPYAIESDEALSQAADAKLELARERLAQCDADRELVAIAERCLVAAPSARLRNAGVVADEVARFLSATEERARESQLAAEKNRVQAVEERKRRKLVVALMGSVLALVVVGAGGWLLSSRAHHERMARGDREIGKVIEHAAELRGERRYDDALARIEQAEAMILSGQASGEVVERVASLHDELRAAAAAAQGERERAERKRRLIERLEATYTSALDTYFTGAGPRGDVAAHFREFGVDLLGMDAEDAARSLSAADVAAEVTLYLDLWGVAFFGDTANAAEPRRALEVARLLDTDRVHEVVRDALVARDGKRLRELARAPEFASLPSGMAQMVAIGLLDAGFYDEVLHALRRAVAIHPRDFVLLATLGSLLADDRRCIEDAIEAVGWLRAAHALRPESPIAVGVLAQALARTQGSEAAIAVCREALAREPDSVDLRSALAGILVKCGDGAGAIAELRAAHRIAPEHGGVIRDLGTELARTGDLVGALDAYRRGLESVRESSWAWVLHVHAGDVLARLRRTTEAEREWEAARAVVPNDPGMLAMVGYAQSRAGQSDRAMETLRDALRIDPRTLAARVRLAKLVGARDGVAAQVAVLKEGLERAPDTPMLLNELAWTLANSDDATARDPVRAVEVASRAAALEPDDPNIANTLGVALYRAGDFTACVAAMRRTLVARSGTNEPHDWIFLAMALERTGAHDEAVVWIEKARDAMRSKPGDHTPRGDRERALAEAEAMIPH